MHFAKNTGKIS